MRRAALLVMTVFLLVASPAQAGWRTDISLQQAERIWGPVPCEVYVARERRPADDLGGWRYDLSGDACRIRITITNRWPLPFSTFCSVVLHEYGHATGFRDPVGVPNGDGTFDNHHSPNPRSVMAAGFSYPDRRCFMVGQD